MQRRLCVYSESVVRIFLKWLDATERVVVPKVVVVVGRDWGLAEFLLYRDLCQHTIEEEFIQKTRQRSSRLFGGNELLTSLPR